MARITDKKVFMKILKRNAVRDYIRQISDPHAAEGAKLKWRGGDLDEVARSAAIQVGLAYSGNEVDERIVEAIRTNADPKKSAMGKDEAVEDAWEAYRLHS